MIEGTQSEMRGGVPLLLALATVAAAATVTCGGLVGTFLPLERAIPLNQQVELEALRARDRARHGRILQGVVGGVVDFSVQGTSDPYFVGYGLYFTKVKLGSTAKEFYVQIDTGSDILWINCITCSNCPHSSGLGIELDFFDTASSSTAALVSCGDPICSYVVQTATSECSSQANQCSYTFQYGDGSGTAGYYVSDTMYFDTFLLGQSAVANSSSTTIFGCSTYQSGDLTKTDKAVDGIFGFGPGALSVISQLSSRGVTPKVFSHCLKGGENGGGVLVLGEILDPSIVYSPPVPSQPHYNLNLQSISVNGQLLPIDSNVFATTNNRGTIVDSGTTLSYLVQEAYNPFVKAKEMARQRATFVNSRGEQYEQSVPKEEKSSMQIFCFNLKWKRILILMVVWVSLLLLQVIKNDLKVCSVWYWVLFCLQFPIALLVFGYKAVKLYKGHEERVSTGNPESICEASIEWTVLHILFCALCGILGGTVGGLLGSGGGFILGPLLIEIGVIPQVASATAMFVIMFSSSLSVVEFYLLKRFPIPYALYLTAVSVLAGFWGQYFVRKLMAILKRASIIVFILSGHFC